MKVHCLPNRKGPDDCGKDQRALGIKNSRSPEILAAFGTILRSFSACSTIPS